MYILLFWLLPFLLSFVWCRFVVFRVQTLTPVILLGLTPNTAGGYYTPSGTQHFNISTLFNCIFVFLLSRLYRFFMDYFINVIPFYWPIQLYCCNYMWSGLVRWWCFSFFYYGKVPAPYLFGPPPSLHGNWLVCGPDWTSPLWDLSYIYWLCATMFSLCLMKVQVAETLH